jgi:PIN domain nuclease of toxin-antitoxin system
MAVSAASAWEIAIKRELGKPEAPDAFEERLRAEDFAALLTTVDDGLAVGRLPLLHRDPFDRILVAQAKREGLAVVTRDHRFAAFGVDVIPT